MGRTSLQNDTVGQHTAHLAQNNDNDSSSSDDDSRSDTVPLSEDSEFERHEQNVKEKGLQQSKRVLELRERFWAAKRRIKLSPQ
eukprot:3937879-Karenia_brevis.AAC.1